MSESSEYRVVYVEPGEPAVEKRIGAGLEDLQEAVGGLIECVYPHGDKTILVCNDEGKLLGMEGNRRLDNGSVIAVPFFVIGDGGGKLPFPDGRRGQPIPPAVRPASEDFAKRDTGGYGIYILQFLRGAVWKSEQKSTGW